MSSGPLLDGDGLLVALDFDHNTQGLASEWVWDPQYNRSVCVDVRFVVWLVGSFDNAPNLV